jgi:phospholipase/carboxylesterase
MADLQVNEVGTVGAGSRLMVLLHGYGADEHDLAPLAAHIDPAGDYFVICPRAPYDVPPYGAGWYERDTNGNIDTDMFLASVDAVDSAIDRACAKGGFDRAEAVVVGFSQGGAMTLASSLRAGGATRPAAIACLSGMMQSVEGLSYDLADGDKGPLPRVLVQHGTVDPMVTIDRGQHTRDALAASDVAHTYREYPMGHEITGESLADLRDWLRAG